MQEGGLSVVPDRQFGNLPRPTVT